MFSKFVLLFTPAYFVSFPFSSVQWTNKRDANNDDDDEKQLTLNENTKSRAKKKFFLSFFFSFDCHKYKIPEKYTNWQSAVLKVWSENT